MLLRSTKNGFAFVLFRYQKKPGSHSSAPRTPGIAQGVALHSCALDFAGGAAPRTTLSPRGKLAGEAFATRQWAGIEHMF